VGDPQRCRRVGPRRSKSRLKLWTKPGRSSAPCGSPGTRTWQSSFWRKASPQYTSTARPAASTETSFSQPSKRPKPPGRTCDPLVLRNC
ncbi:MAG: hypothetical protein BJ554DRAFT_3311, partial [Olpidium bornovanus]